MENTKKYFQIEKRYILNLLKKAGKIDDELYYILESLPHTVENLPRTVEKDKTQKYDENLMYLASSGLTEDQAIRIATARKMMTTPSFDLDEFDRIYEEMKKMFEEELYKK